MPDDIDALVDASLERGRLRGDYNPDAPVNTAWPDTPPPTDPKAPPTIPDRQAALTRLTAAAQNARAAIARLAGEP